MGISTPIDRLFHLPVMVDKYVPTFHDISGNLYSANWNYVGEHQVLPRVQGRAAGVERGQAAQSRRKGTDIAAALAVKQAGSAFRARSRANNNPGPAGQQLRQLHRLRPRRWLEQRLAARQRDRHQQVPDAARPTSRSPTSPPPTTSSSTGSTARRPSGSRTSSTTTCTSVLDFDATSPSGFTDCNLTTRFCIKQIYNPAYVVAPGQDQRRLHDARQAPPTSTTA